MARHNFVGKRGEELAKNFLISKGYEIVEINWRFSHLEIDIIAKHDNFIIFVEVKTRTKLQDMKSSEIISGIKQRFLIHAADIYLRKYSIFNHARFDLIKIHLDEIEDLHEIEHICDAFNAWG